MNDDTTRDSNSPWDPFGMWREFGRHAAEGMFQASAPMAPSAPLQMLIDAARSRLVGKRVGWTVGGERLAFDLEDIQFDPDPLLLAAGQVDDVQINVRNLVWGTHHVESARALLRNIHTRPGVRPRLVAAPIDLFLQVDDQRATELVSVRAPILTVVVNQEGIVDVSLRRRPRWGRVRVGLSSRGNRILVKPEALGRGTRRWQLPRHLPYVSIPLSLPADVRLVGIEPVGIGIELRLRVDERHIDYREAMSYVTSPKPAGEAAQR